MASQPPDDHAERPGNESIENVPLADNAYDSTPVPFRQTTLGKLPPEIRQMIFVELLATPPSYAGYDFATNSSERMNSSTTPRKFVHIKASWHQVTRTCRQIYNESHSVFFASKTYYLANSQELKRLLDYHNRTTWKLVFRLDTITALCLNAVVEYHALYTKDQLDDLFSDPINVLATLNTRQELEAMTFKILDFSLCYHLRRLKSLRTIGLCIRVGEEMEYVDLLYCVSGMQRGLVDFVDASHWLIRPQNPEDDWRIQYACFTCGYYAKGKDNEDIPDDVVLMELQITDIDSRAPGLQKNDERYIEVQVQRRPKDRPSQERLDSNQRGRDWETASDIRDVWLVDSHQAQLEIPQERIEVNAQAEPLEDDISAIESEPQSNQADRFSLLWLPSNDGPNPQSGTQTDQENHDILMEPARKEVSSAWLETQSHHKIEDSVPVAYTAPMITENDGIFQTYSDDEDDQLQDDKKSGNQERQVANLQHNGELHAESVTGTDQMRETLKNKAKGMSRRTKIKYLFRRRKQPLLDISDAPNPYTEEDMESYQEWQSPAMTGNQKQTEKDAHKEKNPSSTSGKTQEHHVTDLCMASKTTIPKEKFPSPASPNQSGVPSKSVQIGAVSLLFLLFVVMSLPPEWLSDA
ncbi:MAG: hypothetical protein Q9175_001966 [Cornicularia normoerica]